MHTARPRLLKDMATGKVYYWLLHWWDHLLEEQHFTLLERPDRRILNVGLVYLVDDLQLGVAKYLGDLAS